MILRPATPLDAGRVGAIMSAWIEETPWVPPLHTRAEDIAHAGTMIDRGWITVAETDAVQGYLARENEEIHAIYVDPQARGQGIGTELISDAMQRENALRLWTFTANTGAQRLYERLGFVETHRTDGAENDENLPDIHYEWKRTAP
ncbi:GNAT family N-acetyltransferase [Marivita hallyeonensis]|uniref:L-amino acid N-acyltransferase YncA n=1 Tax=Marivita hallyeonensis TaxID=996342 RepID=A0A1M5MIC8_9RHOB|nr:GNAT family N-acetyltransferase [Marivita hallyeonensis]SHG76882.1 L-amino acid N-acyltransferase YncA [Marivita hallyeonensis]